MLPTRSVLFVLELPVDAALFKQFVIGLHLEGAWPSGGRALHPGPGAQPELAQD